jgi:phospholipase A1
VGGGIKAWAARRRYRAVARCAPALALATAGALDVAAQPAGLATPGSECILIDDALSRLACYDRVHGRDRHLPSVRKSPPGELAAPVGAAPASVGAPAATPALVPVRASGTGLTVVWELDAEHDRGTFRMVPHRANYLLPLRYGDSLNRRPRSPAPDHSVTEDLPIEKAEAKFQFSFKFKAISSLLGDNGDVWLAYTQQSHWQVFNAAFSSPFRETNYEPEVILSLRTAADVFGWRWQLVNFGLVHQSNGRGLPLSRSWNRVYAQFGLERGNFTLLARPWIRFSESGATDDNPDMRAYYGSGDLRLAYANAGHVWSALGRYSVAGRRGALQFEWAFPLRGALKGYLQLTSGYGESLIDYNHAQTTVGLGLLLLPWQ